MSTQSITKSTAGAWSKLENHEQALTDEYSKVVEQRAEVSAVAYDIGSLKAIKTVESNFSDGWRSKHVARRYKGKEKKSKAKKGTTAWEELQVKEDGAVRVVSNTLQIKKALAEKKWLGEELGEKVGDGGGDKNEEEKEVSSWRKKLRQRRQGAEIKLTKGVKNKGVKEDWQSMVGLESSEIERVKKLKEERKKAEKLAQKKKEKKALTGLNKLRKGDTSSKRLLEEELDSEVKRLLGVCGGEEKALRRWNLKQGDKNEDEDGM